MAQQICLLLQKLNTTNMIEAHFKNIRNLIIDNIRASQFEIKIAVAWFTQKQLYDAVLDALERGVKVSLIMMKDFINCGIYGLPMQGFVDKGGNLHFVTNRGWTMHNKFCLFDNRMVISGSYNWTYSAETRNAENVIATDDDSVCSRFDDYFNVLWEESFAEETVPSVEISSEDVIKDFAVIHDEIEAMVNNKILSTNEGIEVLERAKADADAKIATFQKPLLPTTYSSEIVVSNNYSIVSNPIEQVDPIILSAKPGKAVIIKSLFFPLYNEQHKLIVKRGERLPVIDRNITVRNAVIYEDGGTVFGIEKQQFDDFFEPYYEQIELLQFKGLPKLPPGRIRFDVNIRITTTGKLKMAAYCQYNGRWKYGSTQLIEGEDFIIG